MLTDFGLKPRTPPQRTVANKAEAVEKNLATRTARGTMGARQKAGIHGTVPPATPPTPPATSPTPPAGNAPQVARPGNGVKPE